MIIIIDNLCREIKYLWTSLNESNQQLDNLVFNPIYCENLRLELSQEKERLLILRRSKLDELIAGIRTKIESLWNECFISVAERAQFKSFTQTCNYFLLKFILK